MNINYFEFKLICRTGYNWAGFLFYGNLPIGFFTNKESRNEKDLNIVRKVMNSQKIQYTTSTRIKYQ